MNPLKCVYAENCSGCDWIQMGYEHQRVQKISDLKVHLERTFAAASQTFSLPEIRWIETSNGGMRTRMDLTVETISDKSFELEAKGTITLPGADTETQPSKFAPLVFGKQRAGLYSRERKELVDLESCAQLTPELNSWLHDFRQVKLNIRRGSVRLRVRRLKSKSDESEDAHADLQIQKKSNTDDHKVALAKNFERGIWLDFANVDVKALLDDRKALDQLRSMAVVEIGQKRKRLIERDGSLKLAESILENWFDTYDSEGISIPLYSSIGTFTQPGPIANKVLVKEVLRLLGASPIRKIAEFGSGIGNFTLPLAFIADEVRAFEIDELALAGLSRSLNQAKLSERVQIHAGNFQMARKNLPPLDGLDAVLVDPPRSGVGRFLDPIAAMPPKERPTHFVYVSCFAESFATDSVRLNELGYKMVELAIVDQFPQSRHYEVVSRFEQQQVV